MVKFLYHFFFVTICLSCVFAPEEVYFKEVEQTDPTSVVSLTGYSGDTIHIYSSTRFKYEISTINGILKVVEIRVDDQIIERGSKASGEFVLSPPSLRTGVYELRIQFLSSSGSGSLADVTGLEDYETWRRWVLVVDVDIPVRRELKFENDDGFLRLSWTPYSKPNFLAYYIFRNEGGTHRQIKILNAANSHWIDSSFVGNYRSAVEYELVVSAFIGSEVWSPRSTQQFNFDYEPKVTFNQRDSTVDVTWRESPYYKAIQSIALSEGGLNDGVLVDSRSSGARMKLSNLLFNSTTEVYFSVIPNYTSRTGFMSRVAGFASLGDQLQVEVPGLSHNVDLNGYTAVRNSKELVVFNNDFSLREIIQLDYWHAFQPYRGQLIYYNNGTEMGYFEFVGRSFKKMPIGLGYSSVRGSSNGLISFVKSIYHPLGTVFEASVYDLNNNKYVFSEAERNYINCAISDDGQFIWRTGNKIFQISGTSPVLIGTIDTDYQFVDFRPDRPGELVFVGNTIRVYDTIDLRLLREINFPPGVTRYAFRNYDPRTGNLFFCRSEEQDAYVINIDTGLAKRVKAYDAPSKRLRLVNGYLFNETGRYIRVQ